jgi:hypothetical protein
VAEVNEVEQRRLSRRRLIQGMGVGTAAVWAAPTVLSIGSAAAAASSPVCATASTCGVITGCVGEDCLCAQTTEGTIVCINPFAVQLLCSASSQCPDGSVCAVGDCADPSGDCFALCDGALVRPAVKTTRSAWVKS